ncbi:MAG: hypothetical protein ACT6SF_09810 [Hydrogenophaga sp.]|uniref:hypothetical protein n=1 Tax=Hydrogenophaga sp. TaxID=1904254 RepID=UPI001D360BA0|nr:hypothetical protein [Hydrogenophaga sp.]MBW0170539.1 hypothetical protein [Hydrogenophaga sp.]MBW0182975.1 hypothetical protein [Hydrogenophaga sp.]
MASLWYGAWLVDAAIAITLVEWLALAVYHRITAQGITPKDFQWNLASGLCLMLALRCALQDAAWPWGAGCLAASGAAHVTYLRQRWQTRRRAAQALVAKTATLT